MNLQIRTKHRVFYKHLSLGRGMEQQKSVTFCNVALYFSGEEWMLLEKWEKELYRNVMKEIHGTLISLGYSIVHPDVLVRIKEEQPYYGTNFNTDIKQNLKPPASGTDVKPDILLRIKQDLPSSGGRYSGKEMGDVDQNTTVCTNFNPELSLWIKQVEEPGSQIPSDPEEDGIDDPAIDHPDVPFHQSYSIKKEEEMFPITVSEIGDMFDGSSRDKACGTDWMENFDKSKMTIKNHTIALEKDPGNSPNSSKKGKPYKKEHSPNYHQGQTDEDEQQIPLDGDWPYKCAVCEKSFRFKCHFIRHKIIHTGEKPFKCNQCEKSFNLKENLTKHVMTHSDDKSFKCPECEKGFTSRAYLRIHKRIHTGEKPYKCSECDKSFSHNSYLIHHRRTHTEDKPYKCTDCVKGFVQSYDLMRHMRTHTGEKPFQCEDCAKGFSNKWGLMRHQKRNAARVQTVEHSS